MISVTSGLLEEKTRDAWTEFTKVKNYPFLVRLIFYKIFLSKLLLIVLTCFVGYRKRGKKRQ